MITNALNNKTQQPKRLLLALLEIQGTVLPLVTALVTCPAEVRKSRR